MASNPYGIQQIDIGGVMDRALKQRQGVLEALYTRSQMQAAAKKAAREEEEFGWKREAENARRALLDGPNGDNPAGTAAPVAVAPTTALSPDLTHPDFKSTRGVMTLGELMSGPRKAPLSERYISAMPPTDTPASVASPPPAQSPAPSGMTAPGAPAGFDDAAWRRFQILNPQDASNIAKSYADANKARREDLNDRYGRMGSVALGLMNIVGPDGKPDLAARAAAFDQQIGNLKDHGWTDDQLAQYRGNLTDDKLAGAVLGAQEIKDIYDRVDSDRNYALDLKRFAETQRHNQQSEALTARGQNMTDARGRRNDMEITPSKVIGPILAKVARGDALTAGEANAFNQYKSIDRIDQRFGLGVEGGTPPLVATPPAAQPSRASVPVGQTATNPQTGQKIRWDGKSWQPVR